MFEKKSYSLEKKSSKGIHILEKKKRSAKFKNFHTFNVVVKEWKLQRFNLYCVLQIFHPSLGKKLFIRDKQTWKNIQILRKKKRSPRFNNFRTF